MDCSLWSDFTLFGGICLPDASVPSHLCIVMLLCGRCILSLRAWPHYPFMWLMLLSLVAWHEHEKIIAYK